MTRRDRVQIIAVGTTTWSAIALLYMVAVVYLTTGKTALAGPSTFSQDIVSYGITLAVTGQLAASIANFWLGKRWIAYVLLVLCIGELAYSFISYFFIGHHM